MRFRVVAKSTSYDFHASTTSSAPPDQPGSDSLSLIGSMDPAALVKAEPFQFLFTGAHFGVFSCGALHQPCLQPAVFSEMSVEGVRGGGK